MVAKKFWWGGELTAEFFREDYDLMVLKNEGKFNRKATCFEKDSILADVALFTVRKTLGRMDTNSQKKIPEVRLSLVFSRFDLAMNESVQSDWAKIEKTLDEKSVSDTIKTVLGFVSKDTLKKVPHRTLIPSLQYLFINDEFTAIRLTMEEILRENAEAYDQ